MTYMMAHPDSAEPVALLLNLTSHNHTPQVLVLDNNDLRKENAQLRELLSRYRERFGEVY